MKIMHRTTERSFQNILSHVGVNTDVGLDWRIDLLDIHKQ
jgi:hypothetical protein